MSSYPALDIDEPGILIERDNMEAFFRSMGLELLNLDRSPFEGILVSNVKVLPNAAELRAAAQAAATGLVKEKKEKEKHAKKTDPVVVPAGFKPTANAFNWNGSEDMKKFFVDEMTKVSAKIGLPVNIYVPHGCTVTLPAKSKFIGLYLWGMPSGSQASAEQVPETMWGQPVECKDGTVPNITGVPIESAEGDFVGEIKGNHCFIFFDIAHNCTNFTKTIASKLIAAIEEYFVTGKMTKEDLTEYYRKNFVDSCMSKSKDFLVKHQQDYEQSISQVRQYQQELTKAMKRYNDSSAILKKFETDDGETYRKKFSDEYTSIVSGAGRIKKVVVSASTFSFQTDLIHCVDPRTGENHEIGEFKVGIGLTDGKIKFTNVRRTIGGYKEGMHAPHVFPDGNPCLGNAAEVIPSLVAGMEYSALTTYAMTFLESVNTDDSAGSKIYRWPIQGESEEDYKARMTLSKEREKAGNTPWFKVAKDEAGKIIADVEWAKKARK